MVPDLNCTDLHLVSAHVTCFTLHGVPLAAVHVPSCPGSRAGFLVLLRGPYTDLQTELKFLTDLQSGWASGQLVPADEPIGPFLVQPSDQCWTALVQGPVPANSSVLYELDGPVRLVVISDLPPPPGSAHPESGL